ncbi:hypothetical protein [Intestinibacter bartlettii]|uniref:hypothetical protein n=1 Tax=Intestinibacter bartlettii TaxID=261299 RepID=UPI0011C7E0C4|nr:hypothetical protein [Intestinibacter bartlettii]
MSNGKSSVVEEEYNKAIDYFDLALEAKKDDKEATNLIKQLKLMLEIEESESHGAYFYQMERIDKINAIDTETDVVKKKANDYKEDVLKNIDDSIDYLEEEINDGDYEKAQKDIEDFIKECKKSDSLGEQLDRCEGLLKTCKAEKKKAEEEAKREAEEQQVSSNSKKSSSKDNDNGVKAYCNEGKHYIDVDDYYEMGVNCRGCEAKKTLKSPSNNLPCEFCDDGSGLERTVSLYTGKCYKCGKKNFAGVKKIYNDGTIVYDDGSVENW